MHKRLLVANILAVMMSAGAAQAADMATKMVTKAPVVAPAFSWTGFYIGAHGGYGWGRTEWSDSYDPLNPTTLQEDDAAYDTDGWLAGGQIGFNYQIDQFVIGVEADASWADITGSGKYHVDDLDPGTCIQSGDACRTEIEALGTITARLGVAFDRALFYVKGGAAWASVNHRSGWTDLDPAFSYHDNVDETRWGWTIGGGAEYAFADNWSVKVEYNYIDLGDDTVTFGYDSEWINPYRASVDQHLHIVKAGINYRF
ncbi:MAG: porin [Xanthobacteraceae bacterium]|jgi:outer membrane immunogenic protein|nr:porin [Xanthobacteraceae bacterium]